MFKRELYLNFIIILQKLNQNLHIGRFRELFLRNFSLSTFFIISLPPLILRWKGGVFLNIFSEQEVFHMMNLLPENKFSMPKIFLLEEWKQVYDYLEKSNLYQEYTILRNIVKKRIFSSYNYQFQTIFIYMFNLPYEDTNLKKLHSIFCLYHELRHHHQYMNDPDQFYHHLPERNAYNQSWIERDANEFAADWMQKNRKLINQSLQLEKSDWEIGIQENHLRIYFRG